MISRSFRLPKSSSRLFAAALCSLALSGACSSDEAAPVTPITFGVEVTKLDGHSPDEAVQLRCDRGGPSSTNDAAGGAGATRGFFSTLVVAVATTPAEEFVLRPAHACGASTRCGYVRIEGLDDAGQVVASVDTSTAEGVLELDLAQVPTQIRVSLIRGLDQKALQNPDKSAVTASVTPSFVVPTCSDEPSGGGAGGASFAGNGGEASGGETNAGGASGTPVGGAGGDGAALTPGGAGGAGATDNASGAGGA